MKLSIIIPCKNAEGNLFQLHEKIYNYLKDIKYEIIYIDDGSSDKTLDELNEIYEKDIQHVKLLSFSRSFKKEAAILAGLDYASGEYTCILESNFEQNYKYLLDMYNYLEENNDYDVVAMVANEIKNDSLVTKLWKKVLSKNMDFCNIDMESIASNFRIFRVNVKEAIISMRERNRISKVLFAWIGFKTKYLKYESTDVDVDKLKYDFKEIVAFLYNPLKIATNLGKLFILVAIIYLFIILIQIFGFGFDVNAINILFILVLLLFGIQFLLIGMVGKYLSLLSDETKKRPVYIIKDKKGFDNETIL